MMLTNVIGGTGAGSRMHRRAVPKTAWTCANGHANQRYAATCLHPGCREKRSRGDS